MVLSGPAPGKAGFAEQTLHAYHKLVGGDEPVSETQVYDLLADLMHLCRDRGWDFDELVEEARFHFNEEVKEGED